MCQTAKVPIRPQVAPGRHSADALCSEEEKDKEATHGMVLGGC